MPRRGACLVPTDVYELFRLSLIKRPQIDMFEGEEITREAYLTKVFQRMWDFEHFATKFHYVPISTSSDGPYILGKIGRAVRAVENTPPEDGFKETERDAWKAAVVVVDPRDATDGQKLAFQIERQLGQPFSLISSFAKHVNAADPSALYTIEPQPIFDAGSFWQFADENKGEVVSITFDFVVPNGLWSVNSSLKEELTNARQAIKAEEVSTTIRSQSGINTDSPQIREAVEYAENGSGTIKAKSRKGRRYNSTTRTKQSRLAVDLLKDARDKVARAAAHLAKILGHE